MSITYITDIPFATHNPSSDQPNMQINTNAINQILDIDHRSFNVGAGLVSGQHKQVTFNGFNVPPAQSTPNSVAFTNSTSDTAAGQLFWTNSNATYHISPIRSWGVFAGAAISLAQTVNVASIVRNSLGNYTVTMNANVTASSTYGVLVQSNIGTATYAIGSATVFTITVGGVVVDPAAITFMILQL